MRNELLVDSWQSIVECLETDGDWWRLTELLGFVEFVGFIEFVESPVSQVKPALLTLL